MIDLDRLDADLDLALLGEPDVATGPETIPLAPAPAPAPDPAPAPAWERPDEDDARRRLRALGGRTGVVADPSGGDAYEVERFWVAVRWGDEDERYQALDECRRRAWVLGDVAWQGRLALLLARLGRTDEAERELDSGVAACLALPGRDASWIDLATDLVQAAADLGAVAPARQLVKVLPSSGGMVVALPGGVAKGPLGHFHELATATAAATPLRRANTGTGPDRATARAG